LDHAPALEGDRKVDVGAPPHKPLWHDSDHRADLVVQSKLPSDDVRIAAELSLPETISEHDHGSRLGSAVIRHGRPSNQRRHAHHLKGVKRAVIPSQSLRLSTLSPQDVADSGCDHPFKNSVPLSDLQKLIRRVAKSVAALARIPNLDAHQLVYVFIWKRIEHDGMNHAV